jgi:sulfur-oxidizing protein SoxX
VPALFLAALAALLAALLAAPVAAEGGDRRPVAYVVVDGAAIPDPIAPPGDPVRGAALAADPERAGCLGCHDGVSAPALAGVGARREAGVLRLSVVNLGVLRPEVEGHAFYHVLAPGEAPEAQVGETRLTAQEVEDLVAWLAALRE